MFNLSLAASDMRDMSHGGSHTTLTLTLETPEVDLSRLATLIGDHRPELRQTRAVYRAAEGRLRLAYQRRWPWLSFGPNYQRAELEDRARNNWGIGVGIDLPLFNQNQGEIQKLEAERALALSNFRTQLHTFRAEAEEALVRAEGTARRARLFDESIRAVLEENERLTQEGLRAGQFDLLQLLTVQDHALKGRHAQLASLLQHRLALHDLARAVGTARKE